MKKEFISISRKETSIKLQASEINSIRVKDIERNAVRVYEDGKIGISGAVGSSSIEELTKQGIENLASNIKYPYELEVNNKDHRDYSEAKYNEKELMTLTKKILDSFNKDFDDFIFSNSLKTIEIDYKLTSTEGLDLRFQDSFLDIGLVIKAKDSPNLFDTFTGWQGRNFDVDRYLATAKNQLQAERNKVVLPKADRIPVFFVGLNEIGGFLNQQLNGEIYGNKTSLFDGKLGQQLFNEKLSIVQNNNPKTSYSSFFDTEGVTKENDTVQLIENGVLKNVFTDKKNAKKFSLEHTGSASGGYDDIPKLTSINITSLLDSDDIKKSLNGELAIFALVSAGGEFNADGNYATPVQSAYLFDGEKLIGKLPEFNMGNDIYSMLGKDYIGTFKSEDLYFGENGYLLGCYMNIIK